MEENNKVVENMTIEAVEEEKAQDSIKQPQIEPQNRKQKRFLKNRKIH